MYRKTEYRFADAIEIEEYHSARYGAPGEKRQPKRKPTPEQMAAANQRTREKTCRRKLRANFKEDDYFVTLTYRQEARPPDMERAKKDLQKMLRKLREGYRKKGEVLKWIANIECGTRGAWHVHLVANRIRDGDALISRLWKYGRVTLQLIYEQGKYHKLARYMTKTPRTEPRIREAHYMSSRNLPVPKPKRKVIRWKTFRQIKPPQGWYLDTETCFEGINPVTGFRCRSYTFLRCRRD